MDGLNRTQCSPNGDGKEDNGEEQAEESEPSSCPLDSDRPVRAIGFWDVHGDQRQHAGVCRQASREDMLQPERG